MNPRHPRSRTVCLSPALAIASLLVAGPPAGAQIDGTTADRVFYVGTTANQRFYDVTVLSDATILVCGVADNLAWLPPATPTTLLSATALNGSILNNTTSTSNQIGFILHLSADAGTVLRCVHFAPGAANEIRRMKFTTPPWYALAPGEPTGELYISGSRGLTSSTTNAGYYVARLDGNFVSAPPTAARWFYNVNTRHSSQHDTIQPWDVDSLGRVWLVMGTEYHSQWAELVRLKDDWTHNPATTGLNDETAARNAGVPGWRHHTLDDASAHWGTADTLPPGRSIITSSFVLKHRLTNASGMLRSFSLVDYDHWQRDENGFWRKGRWPLDGMWNNYWRVPTEGVNNQNSGDTRGYLGAFYRLSGTHGTDGAPYTPRCGALTIDRRTNNLYLGLSWATRLPSGNPDFEPGVVVFDPDGYLKWWARLYKEYNDNGPTPPAAVNTALVQTSSPDHYVDTIAIDYTSPLHPDGSGRIVYIGARSHGNNTTNLWSGNAIAANPGASSYHSGFTGTSGNIHLSWVGKYRDDGQASTILASSYVAEYVEGSTSYGSPYTDPNLDLWPSHNSGWPNLNTTRLKHTSAVTPEGGFALLSNGRRTVTTRNAFQRNARPHISVRTSGTSTTTQLSIPALAGARLLLANCTATVSSQTRQVVAFDNATGTITLASALPSAPAHNTAVVLNEGLGEWNEFVRVFTPALDTLTYSSMLTSAINPLTNSGAGDNTDLEGLHPIPGGVLVVGFHAASAGDSVGNPIPTRNAPAWAATTRTGEMAIFARLLFAEPAGRLGDLNADNLVDMADLFLLLPKLGLSGPYAEDLNANGHVDALDLALLNSALGS